ncbi:MAG: hypothetical protein ACYDGR_07705 [Candidatus Dormibacteria bacterium]
MAKHFEIGQVLEGARVRVLEGDTRPGRWVVLATDLERGVLWRRVDERLGVGDLLDAEQLRPFERTSAAEDWAAGLGLPVTETVLAHEPWEAWVPGTMSFFADHGKVVQDEAADNLVDPEILVERGRRAREAAITLQKTAEAISAASSRLVHLGHSFPSQRLCLGEIPDPEDYQVVTVSPNDWSTTSFPMQQRIRELLRDAEVFEAWRRLLPAGRRGGRPAALLRAEVATLWPAIIPQLVHGEMTIRQAALQLGVGVATVSRMLEEHRTQMSRLSSAAQPLHVLPSDRG